MRDHFLAGADCVAAALADPRVRHAWDEPSVLDGQTVGGLCGHLARGSVWVVDDYLDLPVPEDPQIDFDRPADFFAHVAPSLSEHDHQSIRDRGAELAERGPQRIVDEVRTAVGRLRARLPLEPADRCVVVFGGAVMSLDAYLGTRLVEQVVHLDDLSRSVGGPRWELPEPIEDLVLAIGAEIGRRRHGADTMIAALFRSGDGRPFPVI